MSPQGPLCFGSPQGPLRSGSPLSPLLPYLPRSGLLLCLPHPGTHGCLCLQAFFHYMGLAWGIPFCILFSFLPWYSFCLLNSVLTCIWTQTSVFPRCPLPAPWHQYTVLQIKLILVLRLGAKMCLKRLSDGIFYLNILTPLHCGSQGVDYYVLRNSRVCVRRVPMVRIL